MLSTLQCGQIQHMPCTEKSLKYYVHNFDKVSSFLTQTVLILQYAKKILNWRNSATSLCGDYVKCAIYRQRRTKSYAEKAVDFLSGRGVVYRSIHC